MPGIANTWQFPAAFILNVDEVFGRTQQTFDHCPVLRLINAPKMLTFVSEEITFVERVTEYGPIARGNDKWFG
jgi:hypothetical protein